MTPWFGVLYREGGERVAELLWHGDPSLGFELGVWQLPSSVKIRYHKGTTMIRRFYGNATEHHRTEKIPWMKHYIEKIDILDKFERHCMIVLRTPSPPLHPHHRPLKLF